MAIASIQHLLRPQVLTEVISTQAEPSNWLGALFGIQSGKTANGRSRGRNVRNKGHRQSGAYHVYDNLRTVGAGRVRGASAHRRKRNPMALVNFVYPRLYDSIELDLDELDQLGKISNPAKHDAAGREMIGLQTRSLSQLGENWRKALIVGSIRDELKFVSKGDNMWIDFDAAAANNVIEVKGRRPTGNKAKLDMLGKGDIIDKSWDDITADIPSHLGEISAAFQELCGGHLSAVIVTNKVWQNIIKNTAVRNIHGSANAPFVSLKRDTFDAEIAKTMAKVHCAYLSVYPDVVFYITDEGLDLGEPGKETYQKIVPDDKAIFIGHNPIDGTVALYEGSEMVSERDGAPANRKTGMASWHCTRANPTREDIFILDNAMVVNHVPKSEAMGTVIF